MPKPAPAHEMVEGPGAWQQFVDAMKRIAAVSKDELKRRETAWRRAKAKRQRKKLG